MSYTKEQTSVYLWVNNQATHGAYVNPRTIHEVELTGKSLTVEQLVAVARYRAHISISEDAVKRMQHSRDKVEQIVAENRTTYGINTGFGDFSNVSIDIDSIGKLQKNLILSHCCGVGNPYPEEVVRAMMTLRINALCGGYSGIRVETVRALMAMVNAGVHPVVPEKGSLGASGDLAPLAHMVLPMLGYGEAFYQGERLEGAEALKRADLSPVKLRAKEGLALINGTQAMTAVGTLAFYDSLSAARIADVAVALSMEALTALDNAFDDKVQAVRPHPGQRLVAANVRGLLAGSEIIEHSRGLRVQDAYAIRCTPQVHGAVRDTLAYARNVIETEMNSVTDNPIIFSEEDEVISGGNFHGEPMALVFDFLGIAVSEIANISERRLERLVNPALSEGLPEFLTKHGGLHSGYMICQYSAASMVSENKVFAHPASVDSIPSSANQEDHVSMGTTAARKLRSIVENTRSVLAFELMAAAQGMDYREDKPSPVTQKVHDFIREQVPTLDTDREIRLDIDKMNRLVRSGDLEALVCGLNPDFE